MCFMVGVAWERRAVARFSRKRVRRVLCLSRRAREGVGGGRSWRSARQGDTLTSGLGFGDDANVLLGRASQTCSIFALVLF